MVTSLLCYLALLPAQGEGKLEIVNARPTYGYLGAARPRTGILPGDVAHFSFDIKNLKFDETGRAVYSVAIDVQDDKGNLLYQQKPYNSVAQNCFGGNTLPCSAHMEVPLDVTPGGVRYKITVEDRTTKQTAILEGSGKCLPAGFGLIRVGTFSDAEGRSPVAPVGVVGSSLYVNFSGVGFGRDPKTKQPDLEVELRVRDDKGQPTFAKAMQGHVKEGIAPDLRILPLQFALTMNRPGNFTVELTAKCNVCGKTSSVTFPVRILSAE